MNKNILRFVNFHYISFKVIFFPVFRNTKFIKKKSNIMDIIPENDKVE
jgi:hypothetical protein